MGLRLQAAITIATIFAAVGVAHADSLDAARQAGQVGERADGMVGVVGAAPPAVAQAVTALNAQRLATYKDIAQRTGTSLDAVEAQAGQKLTGATPAGQFVMDGSGHWARK